jgi:hypothetical protein
MGQAAGGWELSGYCVPQVTQMKQGMVQSSAFNQAECSAMNSQHATPYIGRT